MSLQSILSILILICAQNTFARYASLNIGLNISAHFSDENNQLTEQLVRICMQETQLSMADLYKFKTNDIQETDVNESTQCFAHCIYEQMGIMRNGLFVDNNDQKLSANAIDGTSGVDFALCKSIRGQNKCETAYKIHQCVQKLKYGGTRDQGLAMNTDPTNNESRNDDNDEDDSGDSQNGQ
ncbi:general odorant-binding protein 56a-like [Episyrphus balteatus]|uniref:general odorant-binding protein 56a-like n=1 Tax=Episyrphus balteatus TaxID=286459 RepID=UPI0024866CA4|nr:general odorant-binding protein 56a-like [Episyrphus balteatus]